MKLAVAAGADVVVLDGMQGGTGATQDVFIEHAGIPTLAAVRQAADALREIGMSDEVQLVVSGGIRTGADVAKAPGARRDRGVDGRRAVDRAGLHARNYLRDGVEHDVTPDYHALSTEPGYCHHMHTGRCPVGIATRSPSWSRWTPSAVPDGWPTTCGR